MNEPQKAYSRRQLISVAEVANALALSRDIAGLEAIQQLAEFAHQGKLCADLYPPHQYWQHGGQSDLIGKPADNSVQVWRSLSSKSVERHMSDKDDFNYPPAASTYHLLADDVFAFAQNGCLSPRAAKAMLDLAVRHKAELVSDQASEPRPIAAPAPPIESQQQAPALAEPPPAQPQAAPPALVMAGSASSAPSNGKVWTPEKLAELRAYRDKQGTKKAAEHFGISGARIRKLLPSDKPKQKGYSAFTHR